VSLQIRDSIKSLFPDRDCYTLVRPMHDERALNHLDTLDPSQLRPEFSEVRQQGMQKDAAGQSSARCHHIGQQLVGAKQDSAGRHGAWQPHSMVLLAVACVRNGAEI
jgi:hypothetical protein